MGRLAADGLVVRFGQIPAHRVKEHPEPLDASCMPVRPNPAFPARRLLMLLAAVAAALAVASPASAATSSNAKRVCAYSQHSVSKLQEFNRLIGRDVDCAQVFDYGTQSWAEWEQPWFIRKGIATDINWTKWATQPGTDRQLIVAQSLIPDTEKNNAWRQAGATGAYADHARNLARNLVAAGLGDAIIRLAPESNGDWNIDSIGTTDVDMARWRQTWRQMVIAMRSVDGARFKFDWCLNNGYRSIAFMKYYPGDDVVDVIGSDAYDSGVPAGQDRWTNIMNRSGGLSALLAFADEHDKPISFPEWGVAPTGVAASGGDNGIYVDNIAALVRKRDVTYQSYFFARDWESQLRAGTRSLAAYRSHFGSGGDAVRDLAPTSPAAAAENVATRGATSTQKSGGAPVSAPAATTTTSAAPSAAPKAKPVKKTGTVKKVKKPKQAKKKTAAQRKAEAARAKAKAKARKAAARKKATARAKRAAHR
jgi:hypothetical protein